MPAMRVVFDFGGVVFRWRPAALVQRVWPHRSASPEQTQRTVEQLFQSYQGDWGQFDQGLLDEAGLVAAVCARTGWTPREMRALLAAVPEELVPQPEVLALIEGLQARGVRLSYLSNMPAPLARGLRAQYPLEKWFESGVFSSTEKLCKPDPRLFRLAADRFGSAAPDCLLVDDHPANIEAARMAGWQTEIFTTAPALAVRLQGRGLL